MHPGDIITHINDKEMKSSADIYEVLSEKGNILNLSLYRGMQRMVVIVMPEDAEQ